MRPKRISHSTQYYPLTTRDNEFSQTILDCHCIICVNTFIVVAIQHDEAVNITTAYRVGQGSTSPSEAAASSSSSSPVNAEKGTAYSRMTGCKKETVSKPSEQVGVGSEMRQHRDPDLKAWVDTYFVWIFHQDILPFGHFQAQVGHGSHYTPTVRQGNVKLSGKIHWAHGRRAQNYMSGVVPRVRARNVAMGQV